MLEKACYRYGQSCPARSCELGCRKKPDPKKTQRNFNNIPYVLFTYQYKPYPLAPYLALREREKGRGRLIIEASRRENALHCLQRQ